MKKYTPAQRILRSCDQISSPVFYNGTRCWIWLKSKSLDGYGRFFCKGYPQGAHRASYLIFLGRIPEGQTIDHLCRNRACVNPKHLEAVPHRINILRGEGLAGKEARTQFCPQGHQYTPANTQTNAKGHRWCRACMAHRGKEWYRQHQRPAVLQRITASHASHLKPHQVREVRQLLDQGQTHDAIARVLGCTRPQVAQIACGRTFKNIR